MLINSYLHRVIQLLENDTTTLPELNQADMYYSRASAMIPPSDVYMYERENLKKASNDLLVVKYPQVAYQMITDPTQTLDTIDQARIYLPKSFNIGP